MEVGESVVEWLHWRWHRKGKPFQEDNARLTIPIAILGVVAVIAGVAGEGYFEARQASAETTIRQYDEQILATAESDAAQAMASVAPLELEAASDREETAKLQKDTQELKDQAAEAELELARLTGPIQSVPVINGIAAPDPTKGLRLRILLHTDVRIKLPTASRGKAVTWTLFIVQDEKGNHQFSTFPHNVMFGNFLHAAPHSFCNMELVTDEYGTTDTTFGAASCPDNESDPIKK